MSGLRISFQKYCKCTDQGSAAVKRPCPFLFAARSAATAKAVPAAGRSGRTAAAWYHERQNFRRHATAAEVCVPAIEIHGGLVLRQIKFFKKQEGSPAIHGGAAFQSKSECRLILPPKILFFAACAETVSGERMSEFQTKLRKFAMRQSSKFAIRLHCMDGEKRARFPGKGCHILLRFYTSLSSTAMAVRSRLRREVSSVFL